MDNFAQIEVKPICGRWVGNVPFRIFRNEVDRRTSWWVRLIDEKGTICNINTPVYTLGIDDHFNSIPIAKQVVVGSWVWNVALLAIEYIEYKEDISRIVG